MLAKFSGLNPKGPYLGLEKEKEKENVCVVLTYFIKRAGEIRKVYVAVVQQRLRNVQKSVMHVHVHVLLQKLSIVVIQKFCYHGNVTSHFSLWLCVWYSGLRYDRRLINKQIYAIGKPV